ncbi:MAG: hypothetical protein VB835_00820 [Pirellulales bacterium]
MSMGGVVMELEYEYGMDSARILMRRSLVETPERPDGAEVSEVEGLIGGRWKRYPSRPNIRHSVYAAWFERRVVSAIEAVEIEKAKLKPQPPPAPD